jgi:hypothetical protein
MYDQTSLNRLFDLPVSPLAAEVVAQSVGGSQTRVLPVSIEKNILKRIRKLVNAGILLYIIDFSTIQQNKTNIVYQICLNGGVGINADPI